MSYLNIKIHGYTHPWKIPNMCECYEKRKTGWQTICCHTLFPPLPNCLGSTWVLNEIRKTADQDSKAEQILMLTALFTCYAC